MNADLTEAIRRLDAAIAVCPATPAWHVLRRLRERAQNLELPAAAFLDMADAIALQGVGVRDALVEFVTRQEDKPKGPMRMKPAELDGMNTALEHVDDLINGRVKRWVTL